MDNLEIAKPNYWGSIPCRAKFYPSSLFSERFPLAFWSIVTGLIPTVDKAVEE
jgi:hypothetical protein